MHRDWPWSTSAPYLCKPLQGLFQQVLEFLLSIIYHRMHRSIVKNVTGTILKLTGNQISIGGMNFYNRLYFYGLFQVGG